VLAVVEPFPSLGAELLVALPPALELDRRADAREDVLRQLATTLPPDATREWTVDTVPGAPAVVIAEAAATYGPALVVLGLGRHAPVDRLLGSEVALDVLRRAACPVLAVPADGAAAFHRGVAAVDFSAASVRAAESAVELLAPDGTLALVHVRPTTSALLSGGAAVLAAWEDAYTRRTEELLARVAAMLRARRPDVRVTGLLRAGAPAAETLAVAPRSAPT
jgi:nucleotide-binding universal stress UspA family protein